jgi:hypothetical protein
MSCTSTSLPFSAGSVDPASVGDPFTRVRYRYGMLLGAEDFTVEQRAHLLRDRLHQALLHGAGTVWGLGVRAEASSGSGDADRLYVGAGLACDAAGRTLYLDREVCWPDAAALATDVWETFPKDASDTTGATRTAWVVIRYAACESQPVPAIRQPCVDASSAETYSRINDRAVIELVSEEPASPFTQLLGWLGREAGTAAGWLRYAGDATLPTTSLRDVLLAILTAPADGLAALWVGEPEAPLVLAKVTLVGASGTSGVTVTVKDVDNTVRALLPSVQAWLEREIGEPLASGDTGTGPFKVESIVRATDGLDVTFTHDVDLVAAAGSVTLWVLDGTGWVSQVVTVTTPSSNVLHVAPATAPTTGARYSVALSGGNDGTPPILSTTGEPLAGWFDDPTPPPGRGVSVTFAGTWSA